MAPQTSMSPHLSASRLIVGAERASAAGSAISASLFHEDWSCGNCGRSFGDATSCCAHEQQCGGKLTRW